ncbi:sensor domain-containing diguanylate cyclase [Alteromonas gilva]|uniref:GAF domain-containing protein n=1 Tax=Alteromonas gilva TaxID=2987522 RepID=A0ABT5L250_9ALTE|nr:GAF domain-containing protein [Alteromonas gilva]MDC8831124.1 GAF domain-containing protein [Alteromonas gilva]
MKNAPQLPDENERIKTLQSLNVLDTPPEERFDRITRLAAKVFQVPIALVSLIDSERQWFKSSQGLNACETGRDISFCGHAIEHDDIFVIENATEDFRFFDNPLVTGEPHIRFYAGCPLVHPNGQRLGTLCLIDQKPRTLTATLRKTLNDLAAVAQLELVEQQTNQLDSETGLQNKQGFIDIGKLILPACEELKLPVSIALLQINGLETNTPPAQYKSVLSNLIGAFNQEFRSSDLVGRYNHNTFCALVTNAGEESTAIKAANVKTLINEKLRNASLIEGLSVNTAVVEKQQKVTLEHLISVAFKQLNEQP